RAAVGRKHDLGLAEFLRASEDLGAAMKMFSEEIKPAEPVQAPVADEKPKASVEGKRGAETKSAVDPPLHRAIARGNIAEVEVLLRQGASVNTVNERGDSALLYAIMVRQTKIAELLVDRGADRSARTKEGNGAMTLCVLRVNPDAAEMLADKGFDL